MPAGRVPEAARERDCWSRPQAPHSLRNQDRIRMRPSTSEMNQYVTGTRTVVNRNVTPESVNAKLGPDNHDSQFRGCLNDISG
jgi:hypothetical protein